MIVDTSALVAIIGAEPERDTFLDAIRRADEVAMSAATYIELGAVVDGRRDPVASRLVDDLLSALHIEVVPLTAEQATVGRAAYRDFGRGSGHPAQLNLGDCYSYALARWTGRPLLYKGDDFGRTDIVPAVRSTS
ncbi:MAG: type II toxin-antitoxin system VapC family toxin [Dermatophilaceae bacterium]